jgi:hypothetical protein
LSWRESLVKERTWKIDSVGQLGSRAAADFVTPLIPAKDRSAAAVPRLQRQRREEQIDAGIEVREEELRLVSAQRVYKMRCACGRSWFELELPKFVHCPACHKLGLVFE